jgi:hypothetical protein
MSRKVAPIITTKLFSAEAITASGSATSEAIDLRLHAPNGIFSIQYAVTGDGTAKFEYKLCSTENGDYIEPSTASDIASSIVKTSGPGSDGKDIVSFTPELAPFMKIVVTETGTAQAIAVSLWLNIQ